LPERDPAVVGRHQAVAVHGESRCGQSVGRLFRQVAILKTAPGQHHAFFTDSMRDANDRLNQRVMKRPRHP
jgi:hypothetical protein